jgi:SAM-dependent methyltransferase/GNAT superfamily N-acetyltransferase
MIRSASDCIHRAERLLEEGGVRHLLARSIQKLGAPICGFGNIRIFTCDLKGPLPSAPSGGELSLRPATTADIPLLLRASDGSRSAADLERRFALGHLCFLALDRSGEAAHSRWVSTDRSEIPELEMDIVLAPGEAYFYDGYTRPDFRGRGVDGVMRCFIFRWLRSAGFRTVYSYVRGDNPVALRAARRWQEESEKIRYLRPRCAGAVVLRRGGGDGPLLVRRSVSRLQRQETRYRAGLARAWFESWVKLPLERRSTGFHAAPPAFLEATADFIGETLELDPARDVVLDVGCDSALISRLVAPRCRRFTGVDLIAGMLKDAPREALRTASGRAASLLAADGRFLPFKAGSFDKIYCCAMIHTLASTEDGVKVIRELLRLCRPGGKVLVASVPDAAKRLYALQDIWRQSGFAARLKLLGSLVLPARVRQTLRSRLGIRRPDPILLLDYDLKALQDTLRREGIEARVLPFPDSYCSRDFLRTRSNLLIQAPPMKESPKLHGKEIATRRQANMAARQFIE